MQVNVEKLTFGYQSGELILENLSFVLDCSGTVALLGGSGVGKSTLLMLLAGAYKPGDAGVEHYTGEIFIDSRSPWDARGPSSIGLMHQRPFLMPHLTAMENVLLPSTLMSKKVCRDRAGELMERLELTGAERKRPRELSGGMQTRVALARHLLCEPRYLFLDEPFNGIDVLTRWNIYRLVSAERRKEGLVTILATHDLVEALLLSQEQIVLEQAVLGTTVYRRSSSPLHLEDFTMADAWKHLNGDVYELAAMLEPEARAIHQ